MAEEQKRTLAVDEVEYVIEELPQTIQNMVAAYDVWSKDRADAQKSFAQMDAAVRQLSSTIIEEVRKHAAEEAKTEEAPAAE